MKRKVIVVGRSNWITTGIICLENGYEVTIYSNCQCRPLHKTGYFIPVTVEYNELMEKITARSWLEFERISRDDSEKSGVKKQLHWVAKSIPKPLPAQNIN